MNDNARWTWTRRKKLLLTLTIALAAYVAFIGVHMYVLQPPLIVSRETTFITEPLRPDGTVDYAAALHEEWSKGVTPENNAAVPLARAFGPGIIAPEIRERYFELIGIEQPPADGEYLVTLDDFLRQKGVEAQRRQLLLESYSAVELSDVETNYPELVAWIEENEKPAEQTAEASRRTRFFSPLLTVSPSEPLLSGLLGTHQQCREAAKLLRLRSVHRLESGDVEGACADAVALHRLGRLVGDTPALIGHLMGIAIDSTGKLATESIVFSGRLSPEQASSFRQRIDSLPIIPDIAESFDRGERIVMLDTLWRQVTGRYRTQESLRYFPKIQLDPNVTLRHTNAVYDAAVETLRESDAAARQRAIADFGETLKLDAYRSPDLGTLVRGMMTGNRAAITEDRSKIIVAMMFPAIHLAQRAENRSMQYSQLLSWAAALAEHRSIEGEFPLQLESLSPNIVNDLAMNDLWGRPLQYRRLDGRFLLYSLGSNGRDDGGWQTGEDRSDQERFDDIRFGLAPVADPASP